MRDKIICLLGLLMVIDGLWSLKTERNKHEWLLDIGRWVRLGVGFILIVI